jgi:hypothetical protein
MKNLEEIIRATAGKFFTVVFTKKDGTERVLNGRLGVVSHLKGGTSTVNHETSFVVWDRHIGEYRSVNKSAITEVRFGKEVFRG